jgi:uncharacterized protein YqjF (DUF2071 family)
MTDLEIDRNIDEGMSGANRVFLSAEWRDLAMLNYEIEPSLVSRYVPPGTYLDSFNGRTYVSLVGFRFHRTKLLGRFPVPFHADFDEVNLRFYVRCKNGRNDRRGVVFIAEVVPKRAIAITARLLYGENYNCLPMKHRIGLEGSTKTVEYQWQVDDQWCRLSAQTIGAPQHPQAGSLEQFITEHYWGYSTQRGGRCLEYHVSHVPWQVWATTGARFEGDASALYGCEFGQVLHRRPDCAFVADGSPVIVFRGNRIE